MGARIRGLILVVALIAVGALAGSAISQRWAVASSSGAAPPARTGERVRVEVLNGGGRQGMARTATDALRDRGFDVVFYGNAQDFDGDSSVVLDRVGRADLAREVADALGIPRVLSQPDSNLYLDVTVVLGEDWTRDTAAEVARPAPLPWWNPRRWWQPKEEGPRPSGPLADPSAR